MKKIISLVTIFALFLTSCSTDEVGPPGPQGPPGLDGLGYTFEETINFGYFPDGNYYSEIIDIPENIVTVNVEADAVLVYRLEVLDDGGDSWSLIPQNFFFNEGTIQYVYNHTVTDVQIIIEGNFDLSDLNTDYTDNQTFRVVVVPSDFAVTSGVNTTNYDAVMNALGIQEQDIPKL